MDNTKPIYVNPDSTWMGRDVVRLDLTYDEVVRLFEELRTLKNQWPLEDR